MNWAGLFCPCQANVWLGSQSHSLTLHMEYIRVTRGKPSRGTSLCKPFSLQEIVAFVWHCWMRWQFLHLKNRQCQVLQIQRFKWQTSPVQLLYLPFLLSRCDVGCSPTSASSAKARCPQNLDDFFRHGMIWFEFNLWEPGRDMSTFVCAEKNLNWEWSVLGAQAIPPGPNWLVIDCHVCLTKASLRSGADTNGKVPVAFGIQNKVST